MPSLNYRLLATERASGKDKEHTKECQSWES